MLTQCTWAHDLIVTQSETCMFFIKIILPQTYLRSSLGAINDLSMHQSRILHKHLMAVEQPPNSPPPPLPPHGIFQTSISGSSDHRCIEIKFFSKQLVGGCGCEAHFKDRIFGSSLKFIPQWLEEASNSPCVLPFWLPSGMAYIFYNISLHTD